MAPRAGFEPAHRLLNRQLPCHLATSECWWACGYSKAILQGKNLANHRILFKP